MRKLFILFLIFFNGISFAQKEVLKELSTNPVLLNNKASCKSSLYNQQPMHLPFMDDFSNVELFPSDSLWVDHHVFINKNYALFPPTIGVATFDALNDTGFVYSNASIYPFVADYLTSRKIRLDSLFSPAPRSITLSDSLYLSFYFQPQGIAEPPDEGDSLTLEFLYSQADTIITPSDTTYVAEVWKWVWSSLGMSLDTFLVYNNSYFKRVNIPIIDTTYLRNDFQFRFKNYASVANLVVPSWASNCDEWNIDYVYLNINRSIGDTSFNDLAFVNRAESLLKEYQSIPAWQYSPSMMEDSLTNKLSNLDGITHPSSYEYEIRNENDALLYNYNGGNENILPFTSSGYQDYVPHAHPPINYSFPSMTHAYQAYIITHFFKETGGGDVRPQNDTIRFYQKFYNYFAYDDGTPEAGYGLDGAPNGRVAYRFVLNQPDTLRSIAMFFNSTLNNASQQYFKITVWDDNAGEPGNVLYQGVRIKPFYENMLNKYHTYKLTEPVSVSGVFYVGWQQTTADNLNIGFDKNTNAQNQILYNVTGLSWDTTMYQGSIMMRPVLGSDDEPYIGIDNQKNVLWTCTLFPNPIKNGILNIDVPDSWKSNKNEIFVNIYNLLGGQVLSIPYQYSINVSSFTQGMYIVRVINKTHQMIFTDKIILSE